MHGGKMVGIRLGKGCASAKKANDRYNRKGKYGYTYHYFN
jgi:hypothetical protein